MIEYIRRLKKMNDQENKIITSWGNDPESICTNNASSTAMKQRLNICSIEDIF